MKRALRHLNLTTAVVAALVIAGGMGIALLVWLFGSARITVDNTPLTIQPALSALTGTPCADPVRRPVAVMLASDPEARPLSGIGAADMVFEMPVTPNGITRMMAVFQCGAEPDAIGSIRSARQDFIPLAQGLHAILAHWGGEHAALDQLNSHVIDNIDALIYEGTVFYRKKGAPAPHNGFTTLERLNDKAGHLGYAASTSMPSYLHHDGEPSHNLSGLVDTVSIDWPQGMDVRFAYDRDSNAYLRWRGGQREMDATTDRQVSVSVVAVITTKATFLRDQYINVYTMGQGEVAIYQNGERITGIWKKPTATSPLTFVDSHGQPIPLTPGPIWVLYDAPLPQS